MSKSFPLSRSLRRQLDSSCESEINYRCTPKLIVIVVQMQSHLVRSSSENRPIFAFALIFAKLVIKKIAMSKTHNVFEHCYKKSLKFKKKMHQNSGLLSPRCRARKYELVLFVFYFAQTSFLLDSVPEVFNSPFGRSESNRAVLLWPALH